MSTLIERLQAEHNDNTARCKAPVNRILFTAQCTNNECGWRVVVDSASTDLVCSRKDGDHRESWHTETCGYKCPRYVVGAVLAQVDDLEIVTRIEVLHVALRKLEGVPCRLCGADTDGTGVCDNCEAKHVKESSS